MRADADALSASATHALNCLRGLCGDDDVARARDLVVSLCKARLFALTAELAEAVSRRQPRDARTRCFYAQALIELGHATAAIDVLKSLASRLPSSDPCLAEATGLLGRAYKQIFFDAGDKTTATAREALKQAIAIYRKPFEDNPANTWHGVNLVALLARARRLGLRIAPDLKPDAVARAVIQQLDLVPAEQRDEWHLPTLAEASLGLNDWTAVEAALNKYVADDRTAAFPIASTLRQFTQVWDIESVDSRGRGLADILRARLLEVGGGELQLAPRDIQRVRAHGDPPAGQLEAILGDIGTSTWRWWRKGLERASAVCSVRTKIGDRIGTGWLVRASAFNRKPADEQLVITNFHVVNEHGMHNGITPEGAEVVFETVDPNKTYAVKQIVWCSPPERLDCSILRLVDPITNIEPLPLAKVLPTLERSPRVYLIGHPGGRELAFSLQDNSLLDHEGPTLGKPAIEGVCRVHYRAPTEGGSSGSPVFNASQWEVIALHHSGGKVGVPKLNGQSGTYAANEGIWVQSILAAVAQSSEWAPPA